ncbi:glycosyltransferase [Methylocystis parvus OBBP]|uniref:glycosyltransferase n=1 Tax=Methylocystis parvus TaxID=134 RepID=UPI001FCC088C|nr:glycosyltransferase [Methylocystis parvus]WBK02158.1 glycosyltransferase [Methylocystis parvus OBBP]
MAHRHALDLKRRGHDVCVFAGRTPKSHQSGGEMDIENVDGLDVHLLSIRSLEPDRAFYWDAAGRRFRATMNDFRPDIVHFHNISGLGANLISEARRYGARTVCTVHDHWGFCAKNTLYRDAGHVCEDFEGCHFCVANVSDEKGKALPTRLRRDYVMRCLAEVDHLVFPSQYLAGAYAEAGFDARRAHIQSNGVEVARFDPSSRSLNDGPLHFVFVGYLGAHKGIGLLLELAGRLLAESSLAGRWRLSIAGDGHMRARIARLVEEAPYRDYVTFLGKLGVDEVPALLASADVVLLPSIWPENEPVVMLEAIAAGRAQLASCIGGHAGLVVDGESGLLFESGDLDDLTAKAVAYIEQPNLARRHGDFNRARRDAFSQETAVSAYEKIYAMTPADQAPADKIILCDGEWPTLETAQLFNNFSIFEKSGRLRFVYAEWADASMWEHASALFCWSHDANMQSVLRALRMNIPIIAPAGGAEARLCEEEALSGFGYKDYAEAVVALASLAERSETAAPASARRANLIDNVAALLDAKAFGLTAERPAI